MTRVNVETLAAKEPYQCHAKTFCQIHGQTGGRADRRENWDRRHCGLLHQFEACTPTHQNERIPQRDRAVAQSETD